MIYLSLKELFQTGVLLHLLEMVIKIALLFFGYLSLKNKNITSEKTFDHSIESILLIIIFLDIERALFLSWSKKKAPFQMTLSHAQYCYSINMLLCVGLSIFS